MIYIDTKKTSNRIFQELLRELHKEDTIPEYIEISSLGSLENGILKVSKDIRKKAYAFSTNDLEISNLYIVSRILDSKGNESIDCDEIINKKAVNEIQILNSDIDVLKINQSIDIQKNAKIKLIITNCNIKVFIINLSKINVPSDQIIIPSIKNSVCDLTIINNAKGRLDKIENLKTNVLFLNVSEIEIKNSEFQIPIFENLFNLKLTLINTPLVFLDNLPKFKNFEKQLNEKYENYIKINKSDIAASLKYLKSINHSSIFSITIDRLFSYLDSRKNPINIILYAYTRYYYNLTYPFVGLIFSLVLFQLLIQNSLEFNKSIGMDTSILPYDLLKNVILKDFFISWNPKDISITKITLLALSSVIYFSIFSISLAIKRRFGYNKI